MQKFVAPDNNSESKPWDSDTWNARTSNTQIFPVASLHPSMHKLKICVTKCWSLVSSFVLQCIAVNRKSARYAKCITAVIFYSNSFISWIVFSVFPINWWLDCDCSAWTDRYTQLMNLPRWTWFQFQLEHCVAYFYLISRIVFATFIFIFRRRNPTICIAAANKCFNCKSSSFRLFQ